MVVFTQTSQTERTFMVCVFALRRNNAESCVRRKMAKLIRLARSHEHYIDQKVSIERECNQADRQRRTRQQAGIVRS